MIVSRTSSLLHAALFGRWALLLVVTVALGGALSPAAAATCAMGSEIQGATRSALEQTATGLFQSAASGDVASLKSSAVPSLASDFGGIESVIVQNRDSLKAGEAAITGTFLLEAEGNAPLERAEFYCGIFNSPDRTTFAIPNLPPGRYGVVTQSVEGEDPLYFTAILSEQAGAWKLAGLTIKPREIGGHDANYFLTQARANASKDQNLLAWLHYLQAWELMEPVSFMYTPRRDKVADEMQDAKPADLPTSQNPMQLSQGGKTFAITEVFPEPVEMDGSTSLYLILRYRAVTDINDTGQTFQANRDAIHALVQRYPDLRTSFDGVVARALDPSGRDYGTMLAMKDIVSMN